MPLTEKEKKLLRKIKKEYRDKGYSPKRAAKIANAVIYSRKRKIERL